MYQIKPIRNEQDYQAALKIVEPFFDKETFSPDEADFFDVMLTLIENYEAKYYPVDLPDPIEAIKFRMEQEGLAIKDLDTIIGKPNRVYEVFSRTRPLTLNMIRKIHQQMGISADVLIRS
ncbi:transcriptional regulator [Haemophilus parahaemolyticus]|uniref:helix-turn-helix domain-containing protein n=1 Tax=Haemophilus parahaemolyticus TaxID=735 RepID=UPI0028E3AD88|nr:transcriptional regulator [Haemophilus parahaemolyticus]